MSELRRSRQPSWRCRLRSLGSSFWNCSSRSISAVELRQPRLWEASSETVLLSQPRLPRVTDCYEHIHRTPLTDSPSSASWARCHLGDTRHAHFQTPWADQLAGAGPYVRPPPPEAYPEEKFGTVPSLPYRLIFCPSLSDHQPEAQEVPPAEGQSTAPATTSHVEVTH